jgi:KRAB domain-containing zinc finger protein
MDDLETPVSSHENIHLDESMDKNQSTVSMTTRSTTEQQIDGVGALRPNETREIDEFECRKCDLKMETVLERLRHEVTVHDYIDYIGYHRNKSFECPICKTHRKSEKSIKLHIHNHIEIDRNELTCKICHLEFKTKNRLQGHILIHNDAEFPCSICGKRFRMEKYVRRHKVEVHKISRTAEKDWENLSDDLIISEEDTIPRECKTESKKGSQLTVESESHCGETGSEVKVEKMKRDDENVEHEEKIVCEDFGEIRDSLLVPKMEDGNINGSSNKEENNPDLESNFQSQSIGNSKTETLSQMMCSYCPQTFTKKYNLTRHLMRKHSEGEIKVKVQSSNIEANDKEFSCGQCDEVFYSLMEKIRHELDVHDLVVLENSDNYLCYKCPICKVSRKTVKSIKMHIQDHFQTNLSELTCRICKIQCKSKNRLQNHMLIHGEAKFPCNICGKKFRMMKYVRRHINETHKKIFSIAKTEDAIASDDIDENVRMKESKQIKPRIQTPGICDVCGKSYTSQASMLNHRTIHFEDRPYPCTKCNKKFRLQNSLRNHMMIHRDTKDYVCEHCGKSFKISQGLRMHRLRYHDKVDYKCEICDRKFLSFGGKKYHILREHKEVADSCGLKLYPCKYCSRRCASYQEYLKHESSHIDNRSHVCDLCDGRWATASQLNVHRKSHFGLNKKFHCKICQFKTSTPWKLKRHLASAKHIDNCLSAGHKSISVAATMENTDIVEKLNSEDGKIDTENEKIKKETAQVQGQTEVVSMETGEIISSPSQVQSSMEQLQVVEVKCCDMTENLVEGSQIFYTEQGGIFYRIVEKGVELDSKTYIYDPSVNQAVESILKLQNS